MARNKQETKLDVFKKQLDETLHSDEHFQEFTEKDLKLAKKVFTKLFKWFNEDYNDLVEECENEECMCNEDTCEESCCTSKYVDDTTEEETPASSRLYKRQTKKFFDCNFEDNRVYYLNLISKRLDDFIFNIYKNNVEKYCDISIDFIFKDVSLLFTWSNELEKFMGTYGDAEECQDPRTISYDEKTHSFNGLTTDMEMPQHRCTAENVCNKDEYVAPSVEVKPAKTTAEMLKAYLNNNENSIESYRGVLIKALTELINNEDYESIKDSDCENVIGIELELGCVLEKYYRTLEKLFRHFSFTKIAECIEEEFGFKQVEIWKDSKCNRVVIDCYFEKSQY